MRLPITAYWSASALGLGNAETAANLARRVAPGMRRVGGDIPGRDIWFGFVEAPLPEIREAKWNFRANRLLALAVEAMHADFESLLRRHAAERVGIVLGASNTGVDEAETFIDEWLSTGAKPDAFHFEMLELGSPALYLRERLGTRGPAYTVSTACSSAAKAFGAARRLIERGVCDAVVTGGVDGRCRFAMNGFHALGALAAERCRPLAPDRDGINLGEAVALFVVEKLKSSKVEKFPSDAPAQPLNLSNSSTFQLCLAGIGETSDAYHATAPDPSGAGAEAAMRAALTDAGLSPADIGYVNLHGTGTIANDAMEAAAVERAFGVKGEGRRVKGDTPFVESTKDLTGHCLGAAGAIEAAICLDRLTFHLSPSTLRPSPFALRPSPFALSNSFAFGGSNASVVFAAD